MRLERLEIQKVFYRFRSFDQHHLHIAQVVKVIELIFQEAAHFLNARMRIDGAGNIQDRQEPPRRDAQIMNRFL
ncbi:MAG TPA: hypothetical protein VLX61_01350 [Anaerolineales bacterium]|nr:hypothetical protein [Anaerolineales bacterium]